MQFKNDQCFKYKHMKVDKKNCVSRNVKNHGPPFSLW